MEKKIVSLQVNDNIDETTKSVTSLKTQLRLAQQEVAALSDKFGDTSKEAVEAAKQAAILKDQIGDAKALTDAFNPDAKFNALSNS
jgi:chromosome segregation ATPase